jgi:hypothetical protein
MRLLRLCSLLGFLLIFGVGTAWTTIIHVPGDYATIQEAINVAVDADTVLVDPGTYNENIDLLGLDIVVTSQYVFTQDSSDIENTVITAENIGGSVVTMTSGETEAAVVTGFTVRDGTGSDYVTPYGTFTTGGGFYLIGSSPTIQNNIITENEAYDGGAGIFSDGGEPVITYNVITQNYCVDNGCGAGMLLKNQEGGEVSHNFIEFNYARHGGGIALKNADPYVTRNVIAHNEGATQAGGMWIYDGSNPDIINNTISDNYAPPGWGGGVQVKDGSAPVFMNNIVSFSVEGGGFVVIGSALPDLSYNLFYCNTGGDYLNCMPGMGDVTGDPAYVGGDPFDYHLTESSAAIDIGNPDPIYNDPDGTRNDAGAFPYDQGLPTPVTLSAFSGSVSPEGVVLSWATASEINNYGWFVQRRNGDETWTTVSDFIEGYGNSNEQRNYTFVDGDIAAGMTYDYRLKQVDIGGSETYSDPITVTVGLAMTKSYALLPNYPNPFNPETTLSYNLPEASNVRLAVFDAAGRLVEEIATGYQNAGMHTVTWNAQTLPSGVYLCRLEANGENFTRILTLVK